MCNQKQCNHSAVGSGLISSTDVWQQILSPDRTRRRKAIQSATKRALILLSSPPLELLDIRQVRLLRVALASSLVRSPAAQRTIRSHPGRVLQVLERPTG